MTSKSSVYLTDIKTQTVFTVTPAVNLCPSAKLGYKTFILLVQLYKYNTQKSLHMLLLEEPKSLLETVVERVVVVVYFVFSYMSSQRKNGFQNIGHILYRVWNKKS